MRWGATSDDDVDGRFGATRSFLTLAPQTTMSDCRFGATARSSLWHLRRRCPTVASVPPARSSLWHLRRRCPTVASVPPARSSLWHLRRRCRRSLRCHPLVPRSGTSDDDVDEL